LLLLAAAIRGPAAQRADGVAPLPAQPAAATVLEVPALADMRVPIHTRPRDAVAGEYGTWTAASTFKASFHDGFVFYPYLGPSYPENLPLRWTTVSVTAGGEPIADVGAGARHVRADWRYEYRYAGLTEAYDVRADGVEQSFVIGNRPASPGDIEVTGRVTTILRADTATTLAAAHTSLTFCDRQANPLVRYGEAHAVDAIGQRAAALTTFDGVHIRLLVPAAFVARATFPLTIDPLTSRVNLTTAATTVQSPAIGHDAESVAANVMVSYSRPFSGGDLDGFAILTNADFSNPTVVYSDVSNSWSSVRSAVAYVGAADRWVVCFEQDHTTPMLNTHRLSLYFHDRANTTANSGVAVSHYPATNECIWYPSLGGTSGGALATGVHALLAYQADITSTEENTRFSKVYSVLVDCATRTVGTRAVVDNGVLDGDNELPCVSPESSGGVTSWVVAWEQFNNVLAGARVEVILSRRTATNASGGHAVAGPFSGPARHALQPRVAGRNGRYCVSMVRALGRSLSGTGVGSELIAQRFDWSDSSGAPVKLAARVVHGGAALRNGGIAFDDSTSSHWALACEDESSLNGGAMVVRVGYSGAVTEAVMLQAGASATWAPDVAFNSTTREFLCVHGSDEGTAQTVIGRRLQYPPEASNVGYGTACGPGTITASSPYAGSEFFRIRLGGVSGSTPAALLLSLGSAAVPLNFLGAPGCVLDVSTAPGAYLLTIASTATAGAPLPLPDAPLFTGDLFVQWAYAAPGLNAAGLGATQGLRIQVR